MVSKTHELGADYRYWFGFLRHQRERLKARQAAYVALGCGSAKKVLLIPFGDFEGWLERMNTTEREDRYYWHVHVDEKASGGSFALRTKANYDPVDLTPYVV